MAGKPRAITPAQKIALDLVRDKGRTLRERRQVAEEQLRQKMREEFEAIELDYALAIRRARDLNATVSSIGRAMGTSDPHTVKRWLGRTERLVAQRTQQPGEAEVFSWQDAKEGIVRVRYGAFPTTFTDAEDYPDTLEGVVKIDSSARNGWAVLEDAGTKETDLGPLPGFLTVEIEQVPTDRYGSLTGMLNHWVEQNRG